MKRLVLGIVQIFALTSAFAQPARFWLATTIGRADTVWLISHDDLPATHKDRAGHTPGGKGDVQPVTAAYLDSMKRLPIESPLLQNSRLNPALVRQQKILARPLVDSLTMILTATIEFDRVESSLCFDPHQAIVWSKDGKLSYIDCCFHCLRYAASADLTQLQGKNFGYRKWAMLQAFFERQGMMDPPADGKAVPGQEKRKDSASYCFETFYRGPASPADSTLCRQPVRYVVVKNDSTLFLMKMDGADNIIPLTSNLTAYRLHYLMTVGTYLSGDNGRKKIDEQLFYNAVDLSDTTQKMRMFISPGRHSLNEFVGSGTGHDKFIFFSDNIENHH